MTPRMRQRTSTREPWVPAVTPKTLIEAEDDLQLARDRAAAIEERFERAEAAGDDEHALDRAASGYTDAAQAVWEAHLNLIARQARWEAQNDAD